MGETSQKLILARNVFKDSTLRCTAPPFVGMQMGDPCQSPLLSLPWALPASHSLPETPSMGGH